MCRGETNSVIIFTESLPRIGFCILGNSCYFYYFFEMLTERLKIGLVTNFTEALYTLLFDQFGVVEGRFAAMCRQLNQDLLTMLRVCAIS